jgi:C-terminal processing protease CtpA/Prc
LINGGSFSASCILSSNLKGSGRALFVGEETGGAFNGTVAGIMPVVTLPESKLNLRLGLALIQPHYKTEIVGRGIFPDVSIKPTLQDRINGNDPELNWVLDDIKGLHSAVVK